MISILKILFTVAVIIVVYLGFKYRWRLSDMSRAATGGKVRPRSRPAPPIVAQDLVPCPKCGAYVAAGTKCSCEKA